MSRRKPQMVTCDVTTLKIFLKHIQPLNDKISGLKVQVVHWQKECERLQMELARVEANNHTLAERLTEVNHEKNDLKRQNADLINEINRLQGVELP